MLEELVTSVPVVEERKKHSLLGIISFSLAIFSFILLFVILVFVGYHTLVSSGLPENEILYFFVGMIIILLLVIVLISMIVGILGILEKNRRKLFGILGVSIDVVMILLVVSLFIIGSMD